MRETSYYREQALRAHRLARATTDRYARINLEQLAADYSAVAEDLEHGAVNLRHPELILEDEVCR